MKAATSTTAAATAPTEKQLDVEVADVSRIADWNRLREDANSATQDEHSTTFLEAVRRYPKAVAWSGIVSLCIIMDGYDTALIFSLFGFPAFQQKYGHEVGDTGMYNLDAKWQMALGMGTPVGNVLGILLNGYLTDRFGHKRVLYGGLISLTGLIFIQVFAPNVETLLVGQLLCGIPWGIFTTMAPAFASEVAPMVLRSYLETWIVCCWGIGQFLSYAVLFSLHDWEGEWAYRIPFALQWMWPVIIMPLAAFCPESPWWLVRNGHVDEAEHAVRRLISAPTKQVADDQTKKTVALMIKTNQLESDMNQNTSFLACFRGSDLWRTEIASMAWCSQVLTGFVIQTFATYFFQQAGLDAGDSFKMTLGVGAIRLLCNIGSAALSGNFGRRSLFLTGCTIMGVLMFLIGGLSFGPATKAFGFATSAVYLVWTAVWCLTVEPLSYVIIGEVSSTRLRSKTMSVAGGNYLIINIINSVVAPYILNPERANWKGKTGLLTGCLTVLSFAWAYFRLPETKGRTFEELDILFAQGDIKAKDFSKAVIRREGEEVSVTIPK